MNHPGLTASSPVRSVARQVLLLCVCLVAARSLHAVPPSPLPQSGPKLERTARASSYYDALGEKAGLYGNEAGSLEAWLYPVKVLTDFRLSFRPAGSARDIPQEEVEQSITVRPESVTLRYAHPLFSVNEILFVPHDTTAAFVLFEVDSRQPLTIGARFLPQMRAMWPAAFSRPETNWNAERHLLLLRGGEFQAAMAAPGWRYLDQEWPVDDPIEHPLKFEIEVAAGQQSRPALAVAGDEQTATALLGRFTALYAADVAYYQQFLRSTVRLETPDTALNEAFEWAKLAIRRGLVEVPGLGRGVIAGYRTSGASERPGFAWFFGRDQMWTALALNAYGDFSSARAAMDFLRRYQRADGKIPHEVSQSANLVHWFDGYPYPWASADSTPLFVAAHHDYWRASGDAAYIRQAWPSLLRAYRYSLSLDTDGNGLLENSAGGHGWVEGGKLLPAKEEIYLQGVWVQALVAMAEMAEAALEPSPENKSFAEECRRGAAEVRARIEQVYWVPSAADSGASGYYAFATRPGGGTTREITILPAVPMWWRVLDPARGPRMLEHIAGSGILTDWGTRILTRASPNYDGTSYHYGSVWPLFTGWAAMAAFRYGRADLGYTLLRQNAQLTFDFSPGAVTELLSGDFYVPTVQSTHHQIWSSAMVATPAVRGLMGIEPDVPSRTLRLEPQLPPGWSAAAARNVPFGRTVVDVEYTRSGNSLVAVVKGANLEGRLVVAPPGRGKERSLPLQSPSTTARMELPDAPQPWIEFEPASPGTAAHRPRLLGWQAAGDSLTVSLEGVPGSTARLLLFTPRSVADGGTARIIEQQDGHAALDVDFGAAAAAGPEYVRQSITIRFAPLARSRKAGTAQ